MKHQIQMKDTSWPLEISGNSISEKFVLIAEKEFSELFSSLAFLWFGVVVLSKYIDARLVKDKTLAGCHYEFGTMYFELH